MTAPTSEVDRIDPEPCRVKLQSGMIVEIVPLKARQFFRLLRVLTHGAGGALLRNELDFQGGQEQFLAKLLSLVLISIPDAENEAIDFIQSMCKPNGLAEGAPSKLTKDQNAANEQLWIEIGAELYNPELEDIIDIVEAIVKQEADDIQALGKRLSRLMELATKTGQTGEGEQAEEKPSPGELASQESRSEENSPGPSTSSPASTAGKTKKSSTSRSADSGKSPTPSPEGSTSPDGSGES